MNLDHHRPSRRPRRDLAIIDPKPPARAHSFVPASRSKLLNSDGFLLVVMVAGLFAAILIAGCTMAKPAKTSDPLAAQHSPAAGPDSPSDPPKTPPQETLAAVEEFLLRTQQYRNSPAPPAAIAGAPAPELKDPLPLDPQKPENQSAKSPAAVAPAAAANLQMDVLTAPPPPKLALPALERVAVRSAEAPADPPTPSTEHALNTAMLASNAAGPGSMGDLLAKLKAEAQRNNDLASLWTWQLVRLAAEPDAEMSEFTALAEPESTILNAFLQTAIAVRRVLVNPRLTPGDGLARVEQLEAALAQRADPVISTLVFCSKVLTYGVYDAMPPEEFVAGRSTPTILYSELRNYRSEKNADGLYETRLSTRIEILSDQGQSVFAREEPEIIDTCRNRRRDFFLAQRIAVPATLPAGKYVLKAYVEDRVAGKATEASLPFTILSPVSIAKRPIP